MVCRWYVATTKHSCEEQVEAELGRQGWEVSLPLARVERRRRDGLLVAVVRPLFSGYIFIKFDVLLGAWKTVASVKGITGLLGWSSDRGVPSAVPENEMEALFACLSAHGGVVPLIASRPNVVIEPGMMVRIMFGPFRDQVAKVQSSQGSRIEVLLRVCGGQRPVRLDREILKAA